MYIINHRELTEAEILEWAQAVTHQYLTQVAVITGARAAARTLLRNELGIGA